ncbi:DNA polymerase III subunit beta [Methylocucumis oryzae]|uniref:Beta sliding clamp n=1 Tax=Methylocucumis oryzae TaxID=1632867 RepID=A0A0F3IKG1_9GAMM|nr:DNA polymerase III subunit beta [Methylocucumis oryzae]KJV07157.1 DNA polymerase III subunit beta [Methylocucumis oryzae]
MKFLINREEILSPLQQIVGVIERRQTMPILANVLIVVEDNTLVLTGTDLEIQIIAKIPLKSSATSGAITVPAKKLLDICRLLTAGSEIKFEVQQNKVKILANRSRFSLSSLPAKNYPEFAESQYEHEFEINAGTFKKGLDKTIFCMANQDVRYYLNGTFLNISNDLIKLVASDGHRLAVFEDHIHSPTGIEARIILPRKGVIELNRILDDPEQVLNIKFSSNHIRVAYANLIFSAKLVDSKYPDFNKVFNQEFLEPIVIQKQLLKEALTRVAVLANEKYKGITLDIDNSLKISTHNPEHEEAEEELSIEYSGNALSISFNVQYILDAIANIDTEQAVLNIAQNLSSCIIVEPGQPAYKFIVMPMKL